MRSLFSPAPALGRSVLFAAQSITETLPAGHPQSLKMAFFVLGDLFSSLPLILPALRRKELRLGKKRSWGELGAGAGVRGPVQEE